MSTAQPHLLLMHGAGLGGWIWDSVIPELTGPGEAVDLPGRGDGIEPGDVTLQTCIDLVAHRTRSLAGRSILVGHSFTAGIALGAAAAEPERVAAVVLVGGLVPESGKSFMSLLPLPQRLLLGVLLRRARNGISLPASLVRKEYCNDLDDATTRLVLARVVPEAPRLYLDRVDWSGLPGRMPRFYVKLLNDASVNVKQQDRMIDRIQATGTVPLATGHLPMLAQPTEMAATLNHLAATL
jgi:pimeloyl-ACP methyl ester carboxylesterase